MKQVDAISALGVLATESLVRRETAGEPLLLVMKDRLGFSILDHFERLSSEGLDPVWSNQGIPPSLVIAELAHSLVFPEVIAQGNAATCAQACWQYLLCKTAPAEYVRIVSGLLGRGREVTLLNGDSLAIERHFKVNFSFDGKSEFDHSVCSSVFQAALVQYIYGVPSDSDEGSWRFKGLSDRHSIQVASGLFEKNFDYAQAYDLAQQDDLLRMLLRAIGTGSIGEESIGTSTKGVNQQPVYVGLQWTSEEEHAVVALYHDKRRIYFYNPHGEERAQLHLEDPPRVSEGSSIESMALAEFRKRLLTAFIGQENAVRGVLSKHARNKVM